MRPVFDLVCCPVVRFCEKLSDVAGCGFLGGKLVGGDGLAVFVFVTKVIFRKAWFSC